MNTSTSPPKQHMSTNMYQDPEADLSEGPPSSPFMANGNQSENIPPAKQETASPSPTPANRNSVVSPLKMLKIRSIQSDASTPSQRSPRKISSPDRRFPVKIALSPTQETTQAQPQPQSQPAPRQIQETTLTINDVLRDNEGLTKAIQILEDEDSEDGTGDDYADAESGFDDTVLSRNGGHDDEGFADETAFSAFSAVPDMTMYAQIGHTPTKSLSSRGPPNLASSYTPATLRRPMRQEESSPTPRREQQHDTTNIIDFTEQFNNFSSARHSYESPLRNQTSYTNSSNSSARTPSPSKHRSFQVPSSTRMSNLLDFDIPPAPTPRSMPSVTPRELEGLKSALLSEISSLKASLSGKEAEVIFLKSAIGDAEKRAGDGMEMLRDERSAREQLEAEKEAWEKRGREMEGVLRNVKEEIVHAEREREDLEGRLDESEKRREAAEGMAQEAESKMAGMRAVAAQSAAGSGSPGEGAAKRAAGASAAHEVEFAVEKVARELHALYKSKHETKVSALKKSYEGRWDRRVKELEAKVEDLAHENEDLRLGRDATMSGVVPRMPVNDDVTEELRAQAAMDAQIARELEARLEGLAKEVQSFKADNAGLREELQQERIEKGELVAACDELLALQEASAVRGPAVSSGVENLRGSISRASGLRAPNYSAGAGESKIRPPGSSAAGDRARSGSGQARPGSGLGMRPGSGLGGRSGIMGSIERMGSYKGRD
ncbi:hypothetical protein VE02_08879 [Pseudogymnoascus sp. 03VT05]|nr:hypothetical protein VE02_08879 [Pseudogymnoascus sp. 03VT05]